MTLDECEKLSHWHYSVNIVLYDFSEFFPCILIHVVTLNSARQ